MRPAAATLSAADWLVGPRRAQGHPGAALAGVGLADRRGFSPVPAASRRGVARARPGRQHHDGGCAGAVCRAPGSIYGAGPAARAGMRARRKRSAPSWARCGASVREEGDTLRFTRRSLHGAEIETYNDHRMAMCFAILGLKVPGIKIKNPACVKKTFPEFFSESWPRRRRRPGRDDSGRQDRPHADA